MEYRAGYKYQLAEDEVFITGLPVNEAIETTFIILDVTGRLTVKAGYAWDGPSGPTIDTKSSMRGSLAHDALYQLLRMGLLDAALRKRIDDLFGDICAEDGMWTWRKNSWVRQLKRFGSAAADPKNQKKVYKAP